MQHIPKKQSGAHKKPTKTKTKTKKSTHPQQTAKRHFGAQSKKKTMGMPTTPLYTPPTASEDQGVKKGKIDINAVEDVFRANRLAGLGKEFHQMNRAFDIVRAGQQLSPEQEADLQRVWDVTSLRTADSAEVRRAKTKALITHYQRRVGDTGSPEVQCVLLTERVNYLKFHMTRHPQDRKLKLDYNMVIVRRRKMLKYLKQERFRTYQIICRDLGINEEELDIVGRLPHKAPYYDPTKPIYRKPLSDAEVKIQDEIIAEERKKANLAAAETARKAQKQIVDDRRRAANALDI